MQNSDHSIIFKKRANFLPKNGGNRRNGYHNIDAVNEVGKSNTVDSPKKNICGEDKAQGSLGTEILKQRICETRKGVGT
jgi:hypothetical protein